MTWLRASVREIFGLFVEDGSFALAILIWLGLTWLVLPRVATIASWSGVIFCAGLIAILVESALRRARK